MLPDNLLHWEEIFKTGTHTDSNGVTLSFDKPKLQEMANLYNSQPEADQHIAPVVLGHPETDAPAYGWVEKLKVEGDKLMAGIRDIKQEFVQWVNNGHYLKKSAAFYATGLLRHVGFLGATPPAVKGLENAAFANQDKFDEYEFIKPETKPAEPEKEKSILFAEEASPEQIKRSKKYSIAIKDTIKRNVRPAQYEDLQDSMFGDPVHYRFPLAQQYIRATLATWNRKQIQTAYTENERRIISARIVKAGIANNINLNPYIWAFSECIKQYSELAILSLKDKFSKVFNPLAVKQYAQTAYDDGIIPSVTIAADQLTNKQLVQVIKTLNNNSKPFKEVNMDTMTADQFALFVQDLLAKVTETLQEEVSAQVGSIIENMKADPKYWTKGTTPPATDDSNTPPVVASETEIALRNEYEKKFNEQQVQLNALQAQNRLASYNTYCEEQEKAGRVLPKQRNLITTLLESTRTITGMSYAEAGTVIKLDGEQAVKKLIESFPTQIEYNEIVLKDGRNKQTITNFEMPKLSGNRNVTVDEGSTTLYNEIQTVIAEYQTAGKTINTNEALAIARKKLGV